MARRARPEVLEGLGLGREGLSVRDNTIWFIISIYIMIIIVCLLVFIIIINMAELCHLYPYPCPRKFYKLPAVLFCYTICSTNWLGHGHGYKWHSSIWFIISSSSSSSSIIVIIVRIIR